MIAKVTNTNPRVSTLSEQAKIPIIHQQLLKQSSEEEEEEQEPDENEIDKDEATPEKELETENNLPEDETDPAGNEDESVSVVAQKNNKEVINIRVPTPPLTEPVAAQTARPKRPAELFKAVIPRKQTLNGFTLSFGQREMLPKLSKQPSSNNQSFGKPSYSSLKKQKSDQ